MAAEYKVSVDLAPILDAVCSPINAAVLPTINQAVRALAAETAYRWKDAVSKAPGVWNGEKQTYIASITWRMTGDFSAVVETDYPIADAIENGRPQRDLKRMLDTSLKVRTVAKGKNAGKRYLIIPFRHNSPGMNAHAPDMPRDVYQQARQLAPSKVTGSGYRASGTGAFGLKSRAPLTVVQKQYEWGDRLPAGLRPKKALHHATDIYAGMVRFKTSAGGASSSTYMTFRVMMEGSPKWIVPAKPGLFLAQKVAQDISAEAPKVLEAAVRYMK